MGHDGLRHCRQRYTRHNNISLEKLVLERTEHPGSFIQLFIQPRFLVRGQRLAPLRGLADQLVSQGMRFCLGALSSGRWLGIQCRVMLILVNTASSYAAVSVLFRTSDQSRDKIGLACGCLPEAISFSTPWPSVKTCKLALFGRGRLSAAGRSCWSAWVRA